MAGTGRPGIIPLGTLLNSTYQIEALLGRGGVGEVYRAVNIASGRTVAIKVLLPQFAENPQFLEMMRSELLRTVSHPAVVSYFDLLRTEDLGGLVFLVMDFIDGPSIADLMRDRGALTAQELEAVARRSLEGLGACHGAGCYHRDLSPDNIILRGGDPAQATLIDFGVAKDVSAGAKTVVADAGFTGKYEYAAPEQLDGRADQRSDLFSLAATLRAAFDGRTPRLGDGLSAIVASKQKPIEARGMPEPLASLVAAMGSVAPADRPDDAAAALAILDGGAPVAATPAATPGATPKTPPARSTRTAATPPAETRARRAPVAAIAALLVAGAAAVWFVPPLREAVLGPDLPLVEPYTFEATYADGTARLGGYAPDAGSAEALAREATALFGTGATVSVEAARGAPNEGWTPMVAALMTALDGLESGSMSLDGSSARLDGIARDDAARGRADAAARTAATDHGYRLALLVEVPVPPVRAAAVDAVVGVHSDCGALVASGAGEDGYGEAATIALDGTISSKAALDVLLRDLEDVAAGRTVDPGGLSIVNASVCRLRRQLPPTADGPLRIVYRPLPDGAEMPGDAFAPLAAPIIDVSAPADLDGLLYAFLVDNEDNVFHLRPAPGRAETALSDLGTVEGDTRTVRLAFPAADNSDASPSLEFTEPYGDMLIFALVTPEPLFPHLRAEVEDVRQLAPDLAARLGELEGTAGLMRDQRFLRVASP